MDDFVMTFIRCYNNRAHPEQICQHLEIPQEIKIVTVLMKILSWLKLEYKRLEWKNSRPYIKSKPLILSHHQWCRDILWLTENNAMFNKYFQVSDNALYINQQISDAEKLRALTTVFDNFNPSLYS